MIMWHSGWEPLTVSQHLALFGIHWFSAAKDITYLICYVTPHDDLIQESCKFVGASSLWHFITPIGLLTFSIVIVEMFLICQVAITLGDPQGKSSQCQLWWSYAL